MRRTIAPDIVPASVDLDDLNSPHSLAVLSVAPGAAVLDLGCGSGVVAKALAARNCKVWGLDIDARRAASARHFCVEVVEGDVEAINLSSAFAGMSFDVILCLDVLEHLRDPAATLVNATRVLAPGGRLLISLPNVTHGALRLELLNGKFRYRDSGLLDRGHLRFFDAAGVDELIRQAGLRSESTLRVMRKLDQTEFDVDLTRIPDTIRKSLESDLDALTYQFFVIARPGRAPHPDERSPTLLERQRARVEELTTALEHGAAYAKHVEVELAASNARVRELEGSLDHTTRERDAKAARVAEEGAAYARHLEAELAAKDVRLGELGESLDRSTRELDANAARLVEAAAYAKHVEAELALKDSRLLEQEQRIQQTDRERDERATRLTDLEQTVADLTRVHQDDAAYIHHLEDQLGSRAGDLAIRDDEVSVLRADVEMTKHALAARTDEVSALLADGEMTRHTLVERTAALQIANELLAQRETELANALGTVDESRRIADDSRALADHLSEILQQPRHRLVEMCNHSFKHRLPGLHRLVRLLVLGRLSPSSSSTESPAQRL